MKDRKGNWMDLFASHALAVDAKKIWLGFLAALGTAAIFALFCYVNEFIAGTGNMAEGDNVIVMLLGGRCATGIGRMLPFFNPFAAGWLHFVLSAVFYLLLMGVWTFFAGPITRLTALQYARDDIPTLNDAKKMVSKKRKAFFFAPVTPLLAVFLFALCNQLAGLIGSIPLIGPWLLTVLLPIGILPGTIVLTFIVVLGVLSFGLMLPSISIGGKDAFEGWSSAYSYLLWGFNRFISYTALAAVIGIVSVLAAAGISELFVALMHRTVSIGLAGELMQTGPGEGVFRHSLLPVASGPVGLRVASWMMVIIVVLIRMLVAAYAFSYFFTANTIICFLMRKHVDKVDIDDVYYEEEPVEEEEVRDHSFAESGKDADAGESGAEEILEDDEDDGDDAQEEPAISAGEEEEKEDLRAESEADDDAEGGDDIGSEPARATEPDPAALEEEDAGEEAEGRTEDKNEGKGGNPDA